MRDVAERFYEVIQKFPSSFSSEDLEKVLAEVEKVLACRQYMPLIENLPQHGVVLDRRILCIPSGRSFKIERLDKIEVGNTDRLIDILKGKHIKQEFLDKLVELEKAEPNALGEKILEEKDESESTT